jgi:TetR/AcrR family transcriptional repressor of nem operon
MRVSRIQEAENHERILDVATRLFRERGIDGIGVSDLMKAAGLTHGGFYGHFKSKEDLVAQACLALPRLRPQELLHGVRCSLHHHIVLLRHRAQP